MFSHLKENFKAGVTVATVSLPLSISLSIASGAGPTLGVITSIWAGLFASFFGSSKYNIVGVAGSLASLLTSYVFSFGLFGVDSSVMIATLPLLTLVTAGVIFIMYFFQLHKYFRYIPSSVMYGFAAGVASAIAATQVKDIVSILPPASPHITEGLVYIFEHISQTNLLSLALFVFAFIALMLWKNFIKGFPAVLPIAILGIFIGLFGKGGTIWGIQFEGFNVFDGMVLLVDRFPKDIALLLENPFSAVFQLPNFSAWTPFLTNIEYWKFIIGTSVIIALIAVLETVIAAKLADKMTGDSTDDKQEILALAVGTVASGCAGGMPSSGLFIRTGLNVRSGGKTQLAGIIAAFATAVFAIVFMPFFQFLPMAVVAAILFNTAIGLLELEKAKEFWGNDKKSFIVYLLVALVVFFHDAAMGILLGSIIALLLFVEGFADGQHSFLYDDGKRIIKDGLGNGIDIPNNAEGVFVYSFEGLLVYLNILAHEKNIKQISQNSKIHTVVLRFRHLFYVDLDGEEMLVEVINVLEKSGKKVVFTSISKHIEKLFFEHPVLREYLKNHETYSKTREMLTSLGYPEK